MSSHFGLLISYNSGSRKKKLLLLEEGIWENGNWIKKY